MKKMLAALLVAGSVLTIAAPADAGCFLFFCPRHYRHYGGTGSAEPRVSGFCKGVQNAAAKSKVSDEDFIVGFPSGQQAKVRKCLESSQ